MRVAAPPLPAGHPRGAPSTTARVGIARLSPVTTAALTTSRHRLRTALAAAAVGTTLLGGCAVFSTVQTDQPYQAADGVNASFGELDLRGVLIVAETKDGPGTVVGQLVNNGSEDIEVTLGTTADAPMQAPVTVERGSSFTLGEESSGQLASVPAGPGDVVQLRVSTRDTGQNVVTVPVLPAEGYYEDVTPPSAPATQPGSTPSPSTSPSEPTPASSPSPSPSPSASPSS